MKKVKNAEAWGRGEARARYGPVSDSGVSPAPTTQPPQFPEDKHGAKYDNDADGWVRGRGKQSPHPDFDHGKFDKRSPK